MLCFDPDGLTGEAQSGADTTNDDNQGAAETM